MNRLLLRWAAAAAILAAACSGNSNLPPPRWERVQGATVVERRFTPEGEHFLGRAVSAQLVARYGFDADPAARAYLGLLGTYLAYANEMPVTYRGYRFGVLATPQIRAFSTPGGGVFVSRGLLEAARSEEELAGVLAHELGHLWNRDGIRSVGASKAASALTAVGTLLASLVGGGGVAAALLQTFEGAVDHAVTDLTVKGYSRAQEVAADEAAVRMLHAAGYPAAPYLSFLRRAFGGEGEGAATLLGTHPPSQARLDAVARLSAGEPSAVAAEARRARFGKATQPRSAL